VTGVEAIAPGLHRWTAWHRDWEEEVASVAVETEAGLVLIDPIEPPSRFESPNHVLVTVFWHHRDTGRMRGVRIWSSRRAARPLQNRGVAVTDPIDDGAKLPGSIRAFATARRGEFVYWLPKQKTVVVGDVLLGAGAKPRPTSDPLRLCPERWLGKASHADLRASLSPLVELPVRRVLPSHGEPVLRAGKRHSRKCWRDLTRLLPSNPMQMFLLG
jgi:glyoxylase-like metal-dependent hydrolase (beta-lactamase superfamily II)